MPEGIFIIDFDEYVGGVVSIKYPDTPEFEVPDNIVQMLQISQNFTPGLLNIREADFNAISYGNEELQKVIVLVLSRYEDGDDFKEIIAQLNQTVIEFQDNKELAPELKRILELSQLVFRAREAVMLKLAQDVTELKNREIDLKNSLKYLFAREHSDKTRIIYALMINGRMTSEELSSYCNLPSSNIDLLLEEMQTDSVIEKQENNYNLLITYGDME
jgi:hypothetical protein